MRGITGLVALALVLILGIAPAQAGQLEDLQAAVDAATAEVTRLTGEVADAQAAYDAELAAWQASVDAYEAHLVAQAEYEEAVDAITVESDCHKNESNSSPEEQQCRADRQAAIDALTPPGEAPPEPGAQPSDAELVALESELELAEEELAAAQEALDAYEPESGEPGEGEPGEGEPGEGEPGEGEPGEPGEGEPGEPGEPGEGEPGEGEPGEGEPGEGEPGEGEPGEGEPGEGEPGEGEPGEPTEGESTEGEPTDGQPADETPTDPRYEVSCTNAVAGSDVTCGVSGLESGQQVRVTVTVNPTLFDDTITADTRGGASFTFAVPADLVAGSVLTITVGTLDGAVATTASLTVVATDGDTTDGDTTDGDTSDDGGAAAGAESEVVTSADAGTTASEELPRTGQPVAVLLLLGLSMLAFGVALSRQPRRVRINGL